MPVIFMAVEGGARGVFNQLLQKGADPTQTWRGRTLKQQIDDKNEREREKEKEKEKGTKAKCLGPAWQDKLQELEDKAVQSTFLPSVEVSRDSMIFALGNLDLKGLSEQSQAHKNLILHAAITRSRNPRVDPLVDKALAAGADINGDSSRDNPPLHRAASLNNYDLFDKLLEAGANPNSMGTLMNGDPVTLQKRIKLTQHTKFRRIRETTESEDSSVKKWMARLEEAQENPPFQALATAHPSDFGPFDDDELSSDDEKELSSLYAPRLPSNYEGWCAAPREDYKKGKGPMAPVYNKPTPPPPSPPESRKNTPMDSEKTGPSVPPQPTNEDNAPSHFSAFGDLPGSPLTANGILGKEGGSPMDMDNGDQLIPDSSPGSGSPSGPKQGI